MFDSSCGDGLVGYFIVLAKWQELCLVDKVFDKSPNLTEAEAKANSEIRREFVNPEEIEQEPSMKVNSIGHFSLISSYHVFVFAHFLSSSLINDFGCQTFDEIPKWDKNPWKSMLRGYGLYWGERGEFESNEFSFCQFLTLDSLNYAYLVVIVNYEFYWIFATIEPTQIAYLDFIDCAYKEPQQLEPNAKFWNSTTSLSKRRHGITFVIDLLNYTTEVLHCRDHVEYILKGNQLTDTKCNFNRKSLFTSSRVAIIVNYCCSSITFQLYCGSSSTYECASTCGVTKESGINYLSLDDLFPLGPWFSMGLSGIKLYGCSLHDFVNWNTALLGSIRIVCADVVWKLSSDMMDCFIVPNFETIMCLIIDFYVDNKVSKDYAFQQQHEYVPPSYIFNIVPIEQFYELGNLLESKYLSQDMHTWVVVILAICYNDFIINFITIGWTKDPLIDSKIILKFWNFRKNTSVACSLKCQDACWDPKEQILKSYSKGYRPLLAIISVLDIDWNQRKEAIFCICATGGEEIMFNFLGFSFDPGGITLLTIVGECRDYLQFHLRDKVVVNRWGNGTKLIETKLVVVMEKNNLHGAIVTLCSCAENELNISNYMNSVYNLTDAISRSLCAQSLTNVQSAAAENTKKTKGNYWGSALVAGKEVIVPKVVHQWSN